MMDWFEFCDSIIFLELTVYTTPDVNLHELPAFIVIIIIPQGPEFVQLKLPASIPNSFLNKDWAARGFDSDHKRDEQTRDKQDGNCKYAKNDIQNPFDPKILFMSDLKRMKIDLLSSLNVLVRNIK